MLSLGGLHVCNFEFGYQLSICSGTKENHRKPESSWPVAGPSGCKLTFSQQPDIEYANPNISLCCCFIEKHTQVVFTNIFICVASCNPCTSHGRETTDYVYKSFHVVQQVHVLHYMLVTWKCSQ
jgi:hypothetical protein